ncbi:MAG: hypothetical protein V1736_11510, partial [Pseudomonadota bacterium]
DGGYMPGFVRSRAGNLLIVCDLLADLGNRFVGLALLNLLVFTRENAFSNLLLMGILEQGPSILLSHVAGFWIDRSEGKKWLAGVNLGKAAVAVLLILSVSRCTVLPLYLLIIVGSLFFYIGRLYITPMIVQKDWIISFNSLNERVALAGGICGPWIISWIVLKAGRETALAVAALLFLIAAFAGSKLPSCEARSGGAKRGEGTDARSLFCKYVEPFQLSPVLKGRFAVLGIVLIGGGTLNLGFPMLVKAQSGTIADWGILMSGYTAGSFLATCLLPKCSLIWKGEVLVSLGLLIAGGSMAIAGVPSFHAHMLPLMILLGFGFSLLHVLLESLIQQESTGALSRTMPALAAFKGTCFLGVMLSSAVILNTWGPQLLFTLGALLMLASSLVVAGKQFRTAWTDF